MRHAEAQIGLVVAVLLHRLVKAQAGKALLRVDRREIHTRRLPDREDQALHQPEHIVLVDEAQLDVDLRELRLAIEAQVLVAKAAHDLEIFVEARHHEQLLEQLRALRERVELAGMQARGHQEVTRAARRVLDQERSLDLQTALIRQIASRGLVDLMAHAQGALQGSAAQVEVAVLEPQLLARVAVVFDGEGRGIRAVEDGGLEHAELDLAGGEIGVLRAHHLAFLLAELLAARPHGAPHADHPLAAQLAGHRVRLGRALRVEDDLGHALAIPQIDEDDGAMIAAVLYPAKQHRFLVDIRGA